MPLESAVYQRDEPYAAVWAEPKQQLPKKLGISDVALGRACRKMLVPVPGRGYWARLASGQRLPKGVEKHLGKPESEFPKPTVRP